MMEGIFKQDIGKTCVFIREMDGMEKDKYWGETEHETIVRLKDLKERIKDFYGKDNDKLIKLNVFLFF